MNDDSSAPGESAFTLDGIVGMALIESRDLSKIYDLGEVKVRALQHVSLDIHQGEFVALIGPSGSGKSTLMNTLGCLDRPTDGSYQLDGEQVAGLSPEQLANVRSRRIGFVFQNFNLLARTTALENVEVPLLYSREFTRRRASGRRPAGKGWTGRPPGPPPEPIVWWPTAARRHCAGIGQPAVDPVVRRADRQPRHTDQPRDHELL